MFPFHFGDTLGVCGSQLIMQTITLSCNQSWYHFPRRTSARENKPKCRCCYHGSRRHRLEQRLEESALAVTLTLALGAISADQPRVTWFKHLHFRTAEVWRLHCDPQVVYLHGGGSARCQRSIKRHANYPGCTGIPRELWVTPGEFAPSSVHTYHPSIHLLASLLWPQKEHSQVASVAWIINGLLKAPILSKLNLRSSCNILPAVK